jgi:hypothetical protein
MGMVIGGGVPGPGSCCGKAVDSALKPANPCSAVILALILLSFHLQVHDLLARSSTHPQFGILWHDEHEDILQLTSLASAVPLVVQCSRTAIGSLHNTARFARIAEPKRLIRQSPWIMCVRAEARRLTTVRTTWYLRARTATLQRPTLRWWRFSCNAGHGASSSCITESISPSRSESWRDRPPKGRSQIGTEAERAASRGRPFDFRSCLPQP